MGKASIQQLFFIMKPSCFLAVTGRFRVPIPALLLYEAERNRDMMTAASKLAVSSEIPHMDTQLQENYQTQQLLLDEMDKYSQAKIAFLLVDS